MADTPIVLSVVMEAAAGREQELGSLLNALVSPTRAEAGCLTYELHSSLERPGTFLFYEKFASQQALDEHVSSAHFQNFVKLRENNDPVGSQTVMRWSSYDASQKGA